MSSEREDDTYGWLVEAVGTLTHAATSWRAGDLVDAQHKVVEAIDILDAVDEFLKAEVGP